MVCFRCLFLHGSMNFHAMYKVRLNLYMLEYLTVGTVDVGAKSELWLTRFQLQEFVIHNHFKMLLPVLNCLFSIFSFFIALSFLLFFYCILLCGGSASSRNGLFKMRGAAATRTGQ